MSNFTSYLPALVVRSVHKIPHLNAQLQHRNGAFGITAESHRNAYTSSLLPMPIICGGIGLLAVFFFQLIFSLYYFWKKRSTLPYIHDHRIPTDPLRNCRIAFVITFITIMVYAQSIPVGNKYLATGMSNSEGRLDYLQSTFTTLTNDGNDLTTDGSLLQVDFSNSYTINNCAAAQQLDDFLPSYYTSIDDYLSYVEDVPGKVEDFQSDMHLYAVKYKNRAVWIFYGWFVLIPPIFFVAMFFNSRKMIFGAIGVAELIMTFAFLLCGAAMVIMMSMADFCMEPSANLVQLTAGSLHNTTLYYTTCAGGNPLQPSLSSAETLIAQTAAGVQAALDSTCPGDVYLLDSLQVISTINATFTEIEATMTCAPIQDAVLGILNGSFCKDTYKGAYTVWQAIFVCAAALFAMTVVSAISSQYFPKTSDAAKTEAAHVHYQTAGGVYESYTPHDSAGGDAPEEEEDSVARDEEGEHTQHSREGEGERGSGVDVEHGDVEFVNAVSSSPVHSQKASPTAATTKKEKKAKANKGRKAEKEKTGPTTADSSAKSENKEGPEVLWV